MKDFWERSAADDLRGEAPQDAQKAAQIVEVLVPVAVDLAYSYRADPELALNPGDFVEVPLGTRRTTGIVVAAEMARVGAGSNLKSVVGRRDLPSFKPNLLRFVERLARWTLVPRGMVLRMAAGAAEHLAPPAPRLGFRATGVEPERATPARLRVLARAKEGGAWPKSELASSAGVSPGVIDALVDCGALEHVMLPPPPPAADLNPDFCAPALEPAQSVGARALCAGIAHKSFQPFLLEGVTGSGKTEVYFEAIAQVLREGGEVLALMPEIALTAQFIDRFARRFGGPPAQWHSGISPRRRATIWEAVAKGQVRVVAGARSALFLPFPNLRLIIVDEEHDGGYKQDGGSAYHARDMAVLRAQIEGACVVLASATPAIETRYNAQQGRYQWLRLPERAQGRSEPSISAIDLRVFPPPRGRWISEPLRKALADNLERGEQSLLFLNRRGYAPLTLCRACGYRFQCPHCTSWLVEHRFRQALMCHQCGHVERRPNVCPECEGVDTLTPCGPGVERLADEVKSLFPNARALVMSSDFPGGIERLRREFAAIAQGEIDIVIGTQLVAKGHNFPLMTLVGAIDADIGLSGADLRAAERSFQLLHQAVGRAGRGAKPGRGLIQSWRPDQPVIAALIAGDKERFYAEELKIRQAGAMPPFTRLAALIVSGADRAAAEAHARVLARAALRLSDRFKIAPPGDLAAPDEIALMGPAEAPIAMARGRYRFRLLARAPKTADLQGFLRALLEAAPKPRGSLRVLIDVDPMNFL